MGCKRKITFGTNRIVILFKNYVIKIPLFFRGRLANYIEWINYINNPDIVATTTRHWYGLKQERLFNCKIETKENLPDYLKKFAIHNRPQIGQNSDCQWKFYDYEDVKYYLRKEYIL